MTYQPRITLLHYIRNKVLLAELLEIPEGQAEYVTAKTFNAFLDEAIRLPADSAYQDIFLNDERCDADKRKIILAVRQNDQSTLRRIFFRQRPGLPQNFASENYNFFTFLMDGFCEEGEVMLLEVVVLYTMACSWTGPYFMKALLFSVKFNQIEVIRFFLGSRVLDFQYCFLISEAITHSVTAEVNPGNPSQISDDNMALLLADERVVFEFEIESQLLGCAARLGKNNVLELFLQSGRGDPNFNEGVALRGACDTQQLECIRLLLADPRVDATFKNNQAIRRSIHHGRDAVSALLISHRSNRVFVLAELSQHPLHLANILFVQATLMCAYLWAKRFLHKYRNLPRSVIVKFVSAQLSLEQRERGIGLFKGGRSYEEISELVFRRISVLVAQTDMHYNLTQ